MENSVSMSKNAVQIKKLPQSTIQMIAAGEVITRPVNVVKELLENSLDAGSTNIRISIELSGLKLIEIIDNGHGISLENAEMLCRRYATSKLATANDLSRISTFGFRGEALASISEMAEVEVKTFNIQTDQMGWEARYKRGNLDGQPVKKYLQNPGTLLKITKLFEATSKRKSAMLLNLADEKKSIVDLVQRYAIHHRDRVTISLKEGHGIDLINVLAPMDLGSCFGMFFGLDIETNLLDFEVKSEQQYQARIQVVFSHKKSTSGYHNNPLILFVNDRLVECADLKRDIFALVHEYFNCKQYQTVLYITIKVPPSDVDVNMHPSKATVALHFQSEIIALIIGSLRSKFQENLGSRSIDIGVSQQRTIGQVFDSLSSTQNRSATQANTNRLALLAPACLNQLAISPITPKPTKRQYELVHNDSSQLSIAQFSAVKRTRPIGSDYLDCSDTMPSADIPQLTLKPHSEAVNMNLIVDTRSSDPALLHGPNRQRRDLKLRSISELKHQVAKEQTKSPLSTIKDSTFVGLFDHERALIQHATKLYAINLKAYLKEQYYQFYLFDFGNFPPIEILPPGNKIQYLIETYLNDIRVHEIRKFNKLKFSTTTSIVEELVKHSALYEDYLAIKLNSDEIITIPCIMPNEIPNLVFLGRFLVDLANQVDYSDERECFKVMGRVIADFYSEPPTNLKDKEVHRKYHDLVETRLYATIKRYLLVPEWLLTKENICQMSDTKDLYKVFERC